MILVVDQFQALVRYVGTDLRGDDIAVAKQHLHHTQVGTMIDQMGDKGMVPRVRR